MTKLLCLQSSLSRQYVRQMTGIKHFLDPNIEWSDLDPFAVNLGSFCRENSEIIKQYLGFTPTRLSNCQIVGELLFALGLKTQQVRFVRRKGRRVRIYKLDPSSWDKHTEKEELLEYCC